MNAETFDQPKVPYNRAVLRWARQRRQITLDEAARKTGAKPEAVAAWETGEATPTVRQARLLADLYGRAFMEFFRDEPPRVQQSDALPDFRLHMDAPDPAEARGLLDIQEWAEGQRLNALDLYETIGAEPPAVPPSIASKLSDAPDDAAARARSTIGFDIAEQTRLDSAQRDQLPRIMRRKLEAAGVLVLKENDLQKYRARGLCIAASPLPVIVFGGEAPGAQAFTLAHELGHVALGLSAFSSGPPPRSAPNARGRAVEDWCNRFAAAMLIPADALAFSFHKPPAPTATISDYDLGYLSRRFCVSRHAMLIRLIELGYVEARYYWDVKRPGFIQEENEYKGGGRSEYYGSRYRSSHGDLYTGLVLEAWTTGRITNHSAAEFMEIKNLRHLEDIRDHFGA